MCVEDVREFTEPDVVLRIPPEFEFETLLWCPIRMNLGHLVIKLQTGTSSAAFQSEIFKRLHICFLFISILWTQSQATTFINPFQFDLQT